jgi:hypothetical protein
MKKPMVGNFDIAESILKGYWKDRENLWLTILGERWRIISRCNEGKSE